MLPFYRMPIAYVAGLAVLGTVAVGLAIRRPSTHTSAEPQISTAASNETPAATPEPDPEPSDGILRTADGLRRKVLIREPNLTLRSRPIDGVTVGEEPGLYSIWYVYGEASGQIHVGPDDRGPKGWLPTDGVLEWDTRVMIRPVTTGVTVYRDRSCLVERLAGRPCPDHPGGDCPGATLTDLPTSDQVAIGLPVIGAEAVPARDGQERAIFEVASLVRENAMARPPAQLSAPDREALRAIDIALVIDTTNSMEKSIEQVKRFAKTLAAEAGERYPDIRLRLGLVEFRDERHQRNPSAYKFTTQITSPFTTPDRFVAAIETVSAANYGDDSTAEQVLKGIATALPANADDPASRPHHLDWPTGRAGELATKLLVLIGDAPDHAPDAGLAGQLAATARDARITIATISVPNTNLVPAERALFNAQWHALAEGSYRPLDRDSGYNRPIDPLERPLDDADSLLSGLQTLLDDRVRRARELADLARAEAEGKLEEYRTRQGLTLDQVALVLEDLHGRAEPAKDQQGRRAPEVRRGWVARDLEDRRLVDVEMLMTLPELERLIEDLRQFQKALATGASREEDLIATLSASASGERGFLERRRGRETFSEYLRRRGLPPARPDTLLDRRQADLLQTDPLARAALEEALSRAIAELTERRLAADWGEPARLADGTMSWVPYAPIDF